MRTCLASFSIIIEFGAVQKLLARSACLGFQIGFKRSKSWNPIGKQGAVKKCAHLLDFVKSFQTSIYCKNRPRYSRERASQSLLKISRQLEKQGRISTGSPGRSTRIPATSPSRSIRRAGATSRRTSDSCPDRYLALRRGVGG